MDGIIGECASADAYPFAYPISSHWVYALTFLHPAFMEKGTGQTCALRLPLWADGEDLLVPVPLPALFIVRQPL